jgi:NADH-quinone oxidoreductase subunit H
VADGIKNFLKEETMPATANRPFFILAPMLALIPAAVTFAVIPFAAPLATPWGVVDMVVADLPIGILYILAFSSLGVYGLFLRDGPRTTSTPSWAGCAPRPRW